jgi:hypothetical protein
MDSVCMHHIVKANDYIAFSCSSIVDVSLNRLSCSGL